NDTLAMISESGYPNIDALSTKFGTTGDVIKKMAADGEISSDDVLDVMKNGTGELATSQAKAGKDIAKTFGESFKIAKDNIQGAICETLIPLLEQLTPMMEPAADVVIGFIEKIPDMIEGIKSGIQWVKDNVVWLSTLAGTLIVAGVAAWVDSGGLTAAGLAIKGVFLAISSGIKSIHVIGWIIAAIGLLV